MNFWESDKSAKDYLLVDKESNKIEEGRQKEDFVPIEKALDFTYMITPLYSMLLSQMQVIASLRKVKSVENMGGIIWIEGNDADLNFDLKLIDKTAKITYSYTDDNKIDEITFYDKKRGLEYKVFYSK